MTSCTRRRSAPEVQSFLGSDRHRFAGLRITSLARSGWLADDHGAYNCVETEPAAGPVSEDETDQEETDFPEPAVEAPATIQAVEVTPNNRDKGQRAHKGKHKRHDHERSRHRGKRGRGHQKH